MSVVDTLIEKFKAGYPGLYVVTSEYTRAFDEIRAAADKAARTTYTWIDGEGAIRNGTAKITPDTANPPEVLKWARESMPNDAVLVLPIFENFFDVPSIKAAFIHMMSPLKSSGKTVIVVSPSLKLQPEIEREFAIINFDLPTKDDLKKVAMSVIEGAELKSKGKMPTNEVIEKVVKASLGLTTSEAENAMALALVRAKDHPKKEWNYDVVLSEKCSALKKSGLLTFYPPGHSGMSQVGGMDNLKDWVGKRKRAFSKEAEDYGLAPPKGILMVGPPGSGKSLGAKAISEELELPLLRCDMGAIFAGVVGASEENARRVIQTAEAVAPCVLWLDEIEKGFAGSGAGSLDSGVGARVLGTFLTWMSDKRTPVFVYATANNVSALPPELLRKGRFDETFSVLLPNENERKEIFKIHLSKRKRSKVFEQLNAGILVSDTKGFSGAEIEAAIEEAMHSSFDANRELAQGDLEKAIAATVPLSKMMAAQIEAMEKWCENRTRPANRAMTETATKQNRQVQA